MDLVRSTPVDDPDAVEEATEGVGDKLHVLHGRHALVGFALVVPEEHLTERLGSRNTPPSPAAMNARKSGGSAADTSCSSSSSS